jgi:hypothetical protein
MECCRMQVPVVWKRPSGLGAALLREELLSCGGDVKIDVDCFEEGMRGSLFLNSLGRKNGVHAFVYMYMIGW